MTNRSLFFVPSLLALALLVGACSRQEDTPTASPQKSSDCDMQGMDMSKMSAEEHQKMMADCAKK